MCFVLPSDTEPSPQGHGYLAVDRAACDKSVNDDKLVACRSTAGLLFGVKHKVHYNSTCLYLIQLSDFMTPHHQQIYRTPLRIIEKQDRTHKQPENAVIHLGFGSLHRRSITKLERGSSMSGGGHLT